MIERHSVPLPDAKLALVLHLPDTDGRAPCVVACHGLSASKDSDKYLLLGTELPRAGLALARFDFRGCGESSGREDETTIATRIEDVRAVLGFLGGHGRLDGRFGLLGSSLGGFAALHVAAEQGDGVPVVTWNAPANLEDLEEGED
ncbi:MAG TPA: alpha/beta hydrolase, partial [Methylomirabilota bacterium]|nr:alpha/beta hydrolase [Methylomirabilota bacterium]